MINLMKGRILVSHTCFILFHSVAGVSECSFAVAVGLASKQQPSHLIAACCRDYCHLVVVRGKHEAVSSNPKVNEA